MSELSEMLRSTMRAIASIANAASKTTEAAVPDEPVRNRHLALVPAVDDATTSDLAHQLGEHGLLRGPSAWRASVNSSQSPAVTRKT
jgi:hypothetical protein